MSTPLPRGTDSRLRRLVLGLVSPLLEKNILKTLVVDAPVVLSMARLVVLGFAVALLHRIWTVGITGWPDAALAIAIVLALPVVDALGRARPTDVLSVLRALVEHLGVDGSEPSKFDDHRQDDSAGTAR
jgi:membrane-bound metal-dependent hydrolase YbcI (DUF457 family)